MLLGNTTPDKVSDTIESSWRVGARLYLKQTSFLTKLEVSDGESVLLSTPT